MGRPTTKYRDEIALRTAVVEHARSCWRLEVGRDWSEPDAAHFRDPDVSPREQLAAGLARRLKLAFTDAAAFFGEYRGSALETSPSAHRLMEFARVHMPSLLDGTFRSTDGVPSFVALLLESSESGWEIGTRGRVVALLGDKLEYWRALDLKKPPSNRLMASVSLLLGAFPTVPAHMFSRGPGLSVGEIFKRETAAIRAAVSQLSSSEP